MSKFTDDHLKQVRLQSDRAFRDMQERADREMAAFLQRYGNTGAIGQSRSASSSSKPVLQHKLRPAQNAQPGQGQAPQRPPAPQQPPAAQAPGAAADGNAPDFDLFATLDFDAVGDQLLDSAQDIREDIGELSRNLREESRAVAQDALKGTSDILKNSTFDLGKRAKAEAAALREAARQAMEEERSLKAMKGRAAAEARKAKERMRRQAAEAKKEAVGSLQELAQEKLGHLREKASKAFEVGGESLKRELGDLRSGKDT